MDDFLERITVTLPLIKQAELEEEAMPQDKLTRITDEEILEIIGADINGPLSDYELSLVNAQLAHSQKEHDALVVEERRAERERIVKLIRDDYIPGEDMETLIKDIRGVKEVNDNG